MKARKCDGHLTDMQENKLYLKNVDYHVPLTTVADEVVGEEGDKPIFKRKLGILNSKLEVVVGLVKFIPEEQVWLEKKALA